MTQEDYVSFETAKLLKEKGFNCPCKVWYSEYTSQFFRGEKYTSIEFDDHNRFDENYKFICYAPTLQRVMKWLREVHNLHIEVYRTACGYLYIISRVPTGSDLYSDGDAYDGDDENSGQWTTCEKACEAAIKYCLENLV